MFLRLSKVKIEYEQNVIYMNIRIIEYTRNTYIRYGFIKWKLVHKAENKDAYKPINPLNLFKKKHNYIQFSNQLKLKTKLKEHEKK